MNSADKPDPLPPEREENAGGPLPPDSAAGPPDDNPYASPLQGQWVAEAAEETVRPDLRAPSAPWSGGWLLMLLVVGLLSGLGLAAAMQVENLPVVGMLIPIVGLGLVAVLVRFLHGTVEVDWPIYLLISAGFGVVSYFAFIPVCFVVGLPAAVLMAQVLSSQAMAMSVAVFSTVTVCGLIFTLLLRLYFRYRYRKQWFDAIERSSHPASQAVVPGDPYGAPPSPPQ